VVNGPLVASPRACCHPRGVKLTFWLSTIPLLALLASCQTANERARGTASVTVAPQPVSSGWRGVASAADQDRIDRLGLAWQAALTEAKERHSKDVASEEALLKPRSSLSRPQPTPGSYNCGMISLGRKDAKPPAFEKFKPFFCYVLAGDDGVLTIVKQTGSQRPAGRLWDDDDANRMIFLGSLALGDEKEPLAYGEDPQRDTAGVFERIGPFKWRLVIPWPRSGSKLEVFELTPVADQPEG
jgi:hypothetical protein